MRLFVAIPVGNVVQRALEERIRAIGSSFAAMPVKWSSPGNWHLTLRFLGEMDPEQVEELIPRLRGACIHFVESELELSGLGCFPNPLEPRVIWVGLTVPSQFMKLAASVQKATEGFGKPERGGDVFLPHVTIGRVKDVAPAQCRALGRELRGCRFGTPIAWRTTRVVLMRSELGPAGSSYLEVAEFRLKKP